MKPVPIHYQEFWFDFAVSDGTYTPTQLRAAGLVVHQGPERTYALTWPGGVTQPPARERPAPRTRRTAKEVSHG